MTTTMPEIAFLGSGTTDQTWWDRYYGVAFPNGPTAHVTHVAEPTAYGYGLDIRPTGDGEFSGEHRQVLAEHFRVPNDHHVRMLLRGRR
jgi:hypothetical protein